VEKGRRGFLKWLGVGGVAGAASILPTGAVQPQEKEKIFLKHVCDCGKEIEIEVPSIEGTEVYLSCGSCGRAHSLLWSEGVFKNRLQYSGDTYDTSWITPLGSEWKNLPTVEASPKELGVGKCLRFDPETGKESER
jgi:hypothetical protein